MTVMVKNNSVITTETNEVILLTCHFDRALASGEISKIKPLKGQKQLNFHRRESGVMRKVFGSTLPETEKNK